MSLIDSVIDDDDEFWYVETSSKRRDLNADQPTAPSALKSLTFPIRISNHAPVDTRYVLWLSQLLQLILLFYLGHMSRFLLWVGLTHDIS